MKKLLSVLLATLLLLTCIPLATTSVSAASLTQAEFNSKLSSAQSKYPTGSRKYEWSVNGSVVGWECHGYGRWLSWYVWGVDFANGRGKDWSLLKSTATSTYIDKLVPGDVIRYRAKTSNTWNHTIFVTSISGNTIYYTDCNSDGNNTIKWNQSVSKSTMTSYLKNKLYGDEAATYGYIAHYGPNTLTIVPQLTIKYHANGGKIASNIVSYKYKVTTSAGLNMRKGAGTGYAVVTSLPTNATFTVKVGDTKTANGYTWGKTTYNGNTGWVVISDYVSKTATNRDWDYYLSSSLVYKSATSGVLTQVMTYGKANANGLWNASTMKLERSGYKFVGWCTKANGSSTIFDQNDVSLKPEKIYPNLKNGNATITLYAIWQCNHKYDNACDTDCNVCGETRNVTHSYSAATCTDPATCTVCGATSGVALGHIYDNACDTDCNVCGAARNVVHSYSNATCTAPATCTVCGVSSGAALDHNYSDNCDTDCNRCGEIRDIQHTYSDDCDRDCNVCGAIRVALHNYANACDAFCDLCGAMRLVDDHHWENGSCTVCGEGSVPPVVTNPAKAGYAPKGEKVSVSVIATGDDLTYEWRIKNEGQTKYSKSSVTGPVYTTTMSDKAKNRRLFCRVYDKYGNMVQSVTMILRETVSIVTQPKNTAVAKGSIARATVKASGDGLTYTWYIKNEGKTKYSKSSVTKATYSCTMSNKSKNRLIYCVVKDKYGNTVKTVKVRLKMK